MCETDPAKTASRSAAPNDADRTDVKSVTLTAGGSSSASLIPNAGGAGGAGAGASVTVTSATGAHIAVKKSAPSKIVSKLSSLGGRFTGFEEQLSLQNKKKKEDDDKRIVALQAQIDAMQATIALEQRNRAASVRALQLVRI